MTVPPPVVSDAAQRLYDRLPEVYRTFDADQDWLLLRYLGACCAGLADIDELIGRVRGSRPVGVATPVPWGLSNAVELDQWVTARQQAWSALGDPANADAAWLPWLATLVGARLDPGADEAERRDTIRYATSGWRAGTRSAIADAARSALSGSRYALVLAHTRVSGGGDVETGDWWDITIITRGTETPDPAAVLGAVVRKGVKPAGIELHHKAYSATWAEIAAAYPTWAERAGRTWAEIQEAGLM